MANSSTLKPLLSMKCPKCHEGNLFTYASPFSLKHIHEMPADCPMCGQPFEPEPGFYTGAMYVNYGITVIITGLSYLILEIIFKVSPVVFFSSYVAILLALGPFLFRYSRVIYLYMFVNYDSEAVKKHKLHP